MIIFYNNIIIIIIKINIKYDKNKVIKMLNNDNNIKT